MPLFHYTAPSVLSLVIKNGLRMSTQGQGDGGVYFSVLGPASYKIGTRNYEDNISKCPMFLASSPHKEIMKSRKKVNQPRCLFYVLILEQSKTASGWSEFWNTADKGNLTRLLSTVFLAKCWFQRRAGESMRAWCPRRTSVTSA